MVSICIMFMKRTYISHTMGNEETIYDSCNNLTYNTTICTVFIKNKH